MLPRGWSNPLHLHTCTHVCTPFGTPPPPTRSAPAPPSPHPQVYDDLGKDRPALGGSKELPYPRHLYNARPAGIAGPGTQVGMALVPAAR